MQRQPAAGRWTIVGSAMIALLMVLCAWPGRSHADLPPVQLDPPVKLVVKTAADETYAGELIAYDGTALDLRLGEDEVRHIAWSEVPTRRTYAILSKLLESRSADTWLELGAMMLSRPDGEPLADRAFARAVRLDKTLEPRVQRLRRGDPKPAAAPGAAGAEAASVAGGVPQTVGPVQADFWGALSDEQQAAAVAQLNAFAAAGTAHIGVTMQLIETQYFLFYSDLHPDEAKRWAGLLDKMYDRLCDLFGIERGVNIWRGKCLILVFAHEADFHRFEAEVHGAPSEGLAAGRCWSYGSGAVHVTFFRQPRETQFAHVLVHEAVHGFVHRYRSPARVTSAWNEGLAEVIAMELVPRDRPITWRQATAELRRRGTLGDFFQADQIEDWQYGVAWSLTEMMIRENKRGYVNFINGIKDGTPWRESLETNYGVTLDRLVAYFGDQVGVRGLRP